MDPWYKIATPRKEVREGRSFNPDEFAIALEQVVAGTAPEDYRDPAKFFARTCFTRAFREQTGMVLRRLAGQTVNTPPVMTLITQFGGGKTHTLAALYHLVRNGPAATKYPGVRELLSEASLSQVPTAKVAVFVGNAWDPGEGRETPWIDIARQLAGDAGVAVLGPLAKSSPPGTENLHKLYSMAGGKALVLCDEVLNFLSRHRDLAEPFRDFLSNLVRSMTGTQGCAAMVSLPQGKPEMSDWDLRWQEIICKEVGRVSKQLLANDEAEIAEVVRRRLFEDIGGDRVRKNVSRAFADWCFERRAQLPAEWTAVDTGATEAKAREHLRTRFEACYPFHPATLSVFQRKWQALPQYQQTRGTLAMFAQWISLAREDAYRKDDRSPLIALGSAPLYDSGFRSIVLSQLGESRLVAAIEADISGMSSHARALDADTKGPLRGIHRRVGTAILFESSGGQVDKVAHLPELRFALGEPEIDTTSIDNAVFALEDKSYFVRKVGSDGFRIGHQPTLKKVVNDRRASLDDETEVKPAMRALVKGEFERGTRIPIVPFPEDGAAVLDTPRLALVVMDPSVEWTDAGRLSQQVAEWAKQRGKVPRSYPASLLWCFKKPGRDLRDNVEMWLAWKRVGREIAEGALGGEFDRADRADVSAKVSGAGDAARDEVWASYRYVVIADSREPEGLKAIDLGAGHASSGETLCGRVIAALKSQALLNESVGAGYVDRNWPPALKESGAWPLASLRQSFLDGSLTRLLDPDTVLRARIVEWVLKGDFGLASGQKPDASYERLWHAEPITPDEVAFEPNVFLLTKQRARELQRGGAPPAGAQGGKGLPPTVEPGPEPPTEVGPTPVTATGPQVVTLRLSGTIPPEVWNRLGTKVIPKMRASGNPQVAVEFSLALDAKSAAALQSELAQILRELGLADELHIRTE